MPNKMDKHKIKKVFFNTIINNDDQIYVVKIKTNIMKVTLRF